MGCGRNHRDTEDAKIDNSYIGLAEKVFLGGRVWASAVSSGFDGETSA